MAQNQVINWFPFSIFILYPSVSFFLFTLFFEIYHLGILFWYWKMIWIHFWPSWSYKVSNVVPDQIPTRLLVLVVDNDPTCLVVLEKMLWVWLWWYKNLKGLVLIFSLEKTFVTLLWQWNLKQSGCTISSIFCFSFFVDYIVFQDRRYSKILFSANLKMMKELSMTIMKKREASNIMYEFRFYLDFRSCSSNSWSSKDLLEDSTDNPPILKKKKKANIKWKTRHKIEDKRIAK